MTPSSDLERVQQLLPSYELGDEIGRGGFGLVLQGRHRQLRREVAIKRLPQGFADDLQVRNRFLVEARLLASLDHPHIVPVHDFVESEGICLLVMEKLSGGSTWERFTRKGLTQETTCALGVAAASALQHAHSRGVLHRDVKPENLLFSAEGVMKVGDFGIAKVLDGGMTMATRAGQVLGTPSYMAPEQALGEPVGPTTDVYALGVTLYEFLSGALPFAGASASPMIVLYQRVHQDPRPLTDVAPDVAEPVAAVVMKSLATSPSDRYPSAEAFGVALAEAAGEAFGEGWLARGDTSLMVGGALGAAAERRAGPAKAPTGMVTPRDLSAARAMGEETPPAKEELVEILELPVPDEFQGASRSLDELQAVGRKTPSQEAEHAAAEVERIHASAHELAELGMLKRLRSGEIRLRAEEVEEAERLLGGTGGSPAARLGLPQGSDNELLREHALAALGRWQHRAENPLSSLTISEASRVLIRSCEGILAQLGDQ